MNDRAARATEDTENRPQRREHAEPSEQTRPIPVVVAAVTLVTVLFGAGYLLWSDSPGRAELGDQRTLADLSAVPRMAGGAGQAVDGKPLYAAHCVACHQASGHGLPGVFPPLAGSEWVKGDERVLVNILLHGISGELVVKGSKYQGAMPGFGHLADAELAAIATYIRQQWSNGSVAVSPERVSAERRLVSRTTPYAGGAELAALAEALAQRTE